MKAMKQITQGEISELYQVLGLTPAQATLFVDHSGSRQVLRVFVFDPAVRLGPLKVGSWHGLPVSIERSGYPEPQRQQHQIG